MVSFRPEGAFHHGYPSEGPETKVQEAIEVVLVQYATFQANKSQGLLRPHFHFFIWASKGHYHRSKLSAKQKTPEGAEQVQGGMRLERESPEGQIKKTEGLQSWPPASK